MELTWYLADLVTEVRVEGTDNSIVHFDLHLLRASNAVEAYDKALRIGGAKATQYLRNDGNLMSFIFRGLTRLSADAPSTTSASKWVFSSPAKPPPMPMSSFRSQIRACRQRLVLARQAAYRSS